VAQQTTISRTVSVSGPGLHSGAPAEVVLHPAPAGTGVVFRRLDGPGAGEVIALDPSVVVDTRLSTVIGSSGGARIATVEHLLAAIGGLGLDNVRIDVTGPEIPALDGSAAPFVALVRSAGVIELVERRRVLTVLHPVEIVMGDRRARFEPADGFTVDVTIDFDDPAIGRQRVFADVTAHRFARDLAAARTFAFLAEVDALRAAGLARGGSLDNCVVLDGGRVLNPEGLRFADEFVRHKALDVVGDLMLAGIAIRGRYVAERPGHALNNAALRALFADPSAYVVVEEAPAAASWLDADAPALVAVPA
jgi:UDP-3-O-[3-hydroxymyristoyl] N-acetylglucosamine deacetylase